MNRAEKFLADIDYAFWDIDKTGLNFSKDRNFIISRMFERGKLDDILKIISFYGVEQSKEVLKLNNHLSREAIHLANVLLDIPLEHFNAYATLKQH